MKLFSVVTVAWLALATFVPPANATAGPSGSPAARAIATELARRLESDFVYADQGVRYAAALTDWAAQGRYDTLSGVALARSLTQDLQSVAPDGHLRVMHDGEGGEALRIVVQRDPDSAEAAPLPRQLQIPSIEQARWLAPGIAFVRFNLFPGDAETIKAASEFMSTHADAGTLIFDLRTHRGGGLDEMDAIFPWLFSKPTRLVTMATRRSVAEAGGSPLGDLASLRTVDADPRFVTREHWASPGKDQRLFKAKVYVLTSGATGSAAEHFALALKASGRGTLIGRATYGANHFGGDQDLGGGFTAFIPVGRTFDPGTGKDWESIGVAPDIDIAPEAALVKALTLAGLPQQDADRISGTVAPRLPMSAPSRS